MKANKRSRNDPNEYLGGDTSFVEDGKLERLSKAEYNKRRKEANKKWKNYDRKLDSGHDPNPRHTLYYKEQLKLLQREEEWYLFQKALLQPLQVSFRMGRACTSTHLASFKNVMGTDFKKLPGRFVEVDGEVLSDNIVRPIDYFGENEHIWLIAVDAKNLAKNEALKPLYDFLLREVALGNLVRQELVSMIPALLLDVRHKHCVLDVCAAPGSKTEQLLLLQQRDCDNEFGPNIALPSGMVVANDADLDRIQILRKRYARCRTPNLLLTCSRAEDMQMRVFQFSSRKDGGIFDRILADVPCSGDGTFRKFPHLWRLFRPRMALELHPIQLQIALASVSMLKVGGRFVYSTCSLNPLEDEAVVAALLRTFTGRLQLVDTRREGLLPSLLSRPGVHSWRCDEDVFCIGEPDSAARAACKQRMPQLIASMYPPSAEEAAWMHLERCHRILPHDQDMGGFFVAVFQLLRNSDSTHKDYTSTVNSAKSHTAGIHISGHDSVETMKKLGFNPKVRLASDTTWDTIQQATIDVFPYFSPARKLYNDIVAALGLDSEKIQRGSIDKFSSSFRSDRLSLVMSSLTGDTGTATMAAVLVTPSVASALLTWAGPLKTSRSFSASSEDDIKDSSIQYDRAMLAVQAGVVVANLGVCTAAPSNFKGGGESDSRDKSRYIERSSKDISIDICCDGIRSVFSPCVSVAKDGKKEGKSGVLDGGGCSVVYVSCSDFLALARAAAVAIGDGSTISVASVRQLDAFDKNVTSVLLSATAYDQLQYCSSNSAMKVTYILVDDSLGQYITADIFLVERNQRTGKRRLSKAELRRVKAGQQKLVKSIHKSQNEIATVKDADFSPGTSRMNFFLVLTDIVDNQFELAIRILTPRDLCSSYSSALLRERVDSCRT